VKNDVFWGLTPRLVDGYHLSFTTKMEVSHGLQKTVKPNGHRSENFEANNVTAITSCRPIRADHATCIMHEKYIGWTKIHLSG
jgi:hypothetical protein